MTDTLNGAASLRLVDKPNESAAIQPTAAADRRGPDAAEPENEPETTDLQNGEDHGETFSAADMEATEDGDGEPLDVMTEVRALALLEPAVFAVDRVKHGKRLGLSLKALDEAVKAERRKIRREQRRAKSDADIDEDYYFVTERGTFWRRTTFDGESIVLQLANFSARIVREVTEDDGVETRKTYELDVDVEGFQRWQVIIPAGEFSNPNWIDKELPAEAYVHPSGPAAPRLRHAIKRRSAPVVKHRLYTHTGWRLIDGKYVFLHGDGAIGEHGPVEGVSVKLHSKLKGVRLPAPPEGEELIRAVRASLNLLSLAPFDVTVPSVGAAIRAPLGNARYSPFACAETNSQKSALAGVLMTHFGTQWSYNNLPLSFTIDTITTMEAVVFEAKDILIIPDDLKYTDGNQKTLNNMADRFFRGIANGAGRGKCFPDGTPRPDKPPRAMAYGTGEELPPGHSLRSRLLMITFKRGDIDLDRLTEAQRNGERGLHAQAMSGYLRWLAPRYEQIASTWEENIRRLRENAEKFPLGRTRDMLIDMYLGWSKFLDFACETGAITEVGANDLLEDIRNSLIRLGKTQNDELQGANPVERFIEIIRTLLTTGRAHVASLNGSENGGAPTHDPQRWGWRHTDQLALHPCGDLIGWVDEDNLYLEGKSAFAAARDFSKREGEELSLRSPQLFKNMHAAGWLVSDSMHCKEPVRTVRVPLRGGARPWAYHLSAKRVMGDSVMGDPEEPG